MANVYVDSTVLAVGTRVEGIFDPTTGSEVTVEVTSSGERQKGGCSCHPQWYDVFTARVVDGFEPGRQVRGYTNEFEQQDDDTDVCAFLMEEPDTDWLVRDIRLTQEQAPEWAGEQLRVMEHTLMLRQQLEAEGMDAEWLRQVLQHPYGGCSVAQTHPDLRYEGGCGKPHHIRTGWSGGCEITHDGRLVEENWMGPLSCTDCKTYRVQDATVVRLSSGPAGPGWRAHAPVFVMSTDATIETVRRILPCA